MANTPTTGSPIQKRTPLAHDKRYDFSADDFAKYDLDTIDGRAQAVRMILETMDCYEDSDPKYTDHLLEAYSMLANSGLYKGEAIRKFTPDELMTFQTGTYKAATAAGALTSYVSLLHPMFSLTNPTLATDAHFRISIGAWFFDPSMNSRHRAALIIHEVMHGVLGHYDLVRLDPKKVNLAGDAVINQGIERSQGEGTMLMPENADHTTSFVYPRTIITKKYPKGMDDHESFMTYYLALEEEEEEQAKQSGSLQQQGQNGDGDSGQGDGDQNGQGRSQSGSQGNQNKSDDNGSQKDQQGQGGSDSDEGNGSGNGAYMNYSDGSSVRMDGGSSAPCQGMSPEDSAAFDKSNVEKAGDIDKEMARAAAEAAAMQQASQKSRSGYGSDFNDFILDALRPPKVRWSVILSNIMSRNFNSIVNGKSDYSYRRVNRRQSGEFIRPAMIAYAPRVLIGTDTSGSMSADDYQNAISEVEGVCRAMQVSDMDFITVDTEITSIQPVRRAKDLKLGSGGGTRMAVFYQYVKERVKMRNRPDVTVLATDCFIDWDDVIKEIDPTMKNIILCTSEQGWEYAQQYADGHVPGLTVLPIF